MNKKEKEKELEMYRRASNEIWFMCPGPMCGWAGADPDTKDKNNNYICPKCRTPL